MCYRVCYNVCYSVTKPVVTEAVVVACLHLVFIQALQEKEDEVVADLITNDLEQDQLDYSETFEIIH